MQPEFGKRDPTFVVLSYGYVLTSKYVWEYSYGKKNCWYHIYSSKCQLKREKSRFFMLYSKKIDTNPQKPMDLQKHSRLCDTRLP